MYTYIYAHTCIVYTYMLIYLHIYSYLYLFLGVFNLQYHFLLNLTSLSLILVVKFDQNIIVAPRSLPFSDSVTELKGSVSARA